jgi:hypothetical protein
LASWSVASAARSPDVPPATERPCFDRFQAGDGFAEIADDFGVPAEEVEDVIRVALRLAG